MAACPYWLAYYIEEYGPYLYHAVTNNDHIDSILEEGLKPWDSLPNHVSPYPRRLWPRPGHVYLRCAIPRARYDLGIRTLRVDLRMLDPARLNPDEDTMAYGRAKELWPGVEEVEWRNSGAIRGEERSRGEWAEWRAFSQPAQTAWSMLMISHEGTGDRSVAHCGIIQPEAISHPYAERQAGLVATETPRAEIAA